LFNQGFFYVKIQDKEQNLKKYFCNLKNCISKKCKRIHACKKKRSSALRLSW